MKTVIVRQLGQSDILLPSLVAEGLAGRVAERFRRYLGALGLPREQAETLTLPTEPRALSYAVGAALKAPARLRQELLAEDSVDRRLRRELALMEFQTGGPAEPSARQFSRN